MKKHGVSYSNVVNEKPFAIPAIQLKFKGEFSLKAQSRLDPLSRELHRKGFILSDRYYVSVEEKYTFYSREKFFKPISFYESHMKDELAELRSDDSQKSLPIWASEEMRPLKKTEKKEGSFLEQMSKVYQAKAVEVIPLSKRIANKPSTSTTVSTLSYPPPKRENKDCGCGRKKKNAKTDRRPS